MPANFNDSTPAAPGGHVNIAWQKDGSGNISANIATPGSVSSVAVTVPAEFSVSGSPVTTTGTIAITKATESANTVWAGPTTGAAAQPAFRALVAADLPGGTGTVSSVALTAPAEFSVSGSPVTTSGTLALSKATQSANTVWAGPTSGGAAQPAFRALVLTDLPAGTITNFADNETPSGTINSSNVTFTLANTPTPAASLILTVNGVVQYAAVDYTLTTNVITMASAPTTGALIRAWYRY